MVLWNLRKCSELQKPVRGRSRQEAEMGRREATFHGVTPPPGLPLEQ